MTTKGRDVLFLMRLKDAMFERVRLRPVALDRVLSTRRAWPMLLVLLVLGCSAGGQATDAAAGRAIYEQRCTTCHGDAATGEGALPGAPVHGPQGHTWHHADGQLVEIILGRLAFPGKTMPPFEGVLTEAEVKGVLDYIKTGWNRDQIQRQRDVSAQWDKLYPSR